MSRNASPQQQKESLGEPEHPVDTRRPPEGKITKGGNATEMTTTAKTSDPLVTSRQQHLDPNVQSATSLVQDQARVSKSIAIEDVIYNDSDDDHIKGTDRGDTSKQDKIKANRDEEELPPWLSPTGARAVQPWKALMRVPWPAGIQPEFRTVFCHRWGYRCGSGFDGLAVESACGKADGAQLAVDRVGTPVGQGVPATPGPAAPGSLLKTITKIISGNEPLRMQLPRCKMGLSFRTAVALRSFQLGHTKRRPSFPRGRHVLGNSYLGSRNYLGPHNDLFLCSLSLPFLWMSCSLREPSSLSPGTCLAVYFQAALPHSVDFHGMLLLCHLAFLCFRTTEPGKACSVVFEPATYDQCSIGAPG